MSRAAAARAWNLCCALSMYRARRLRQASRAIQLLGARDDVDVIIVPAAAVPGRFVGVQRRGHCAGRLCLPCAACVCHGHEIELLHSGLCADLRAPTPSAAAELATPDMWGELAFLCRMQIFKKACKKLALCYNEIRVAGSSSARRAAHRPKEKGTALRAGGGGV